MDASTPPGAVPHLRRDAARNRDKILAVARAAFDEEGVEVGVEVIAHRAGVGVGTLYRRFPTKEDLIDAVMEEVLQAVRQAAEDALAVEPAGDGFASYLRAVGWLHFEHIGCVARLWRGDPSELRDRIEAATRTLLVRAKLAGTVRDDLVYEDVVLLFWSLRGVIEGTAAVSPEAWLRHLDLLMDAVGPSRRALEHPPPSTETIHAVMADSAARRGSRKRPAD